MTTIPNHFRPPCNDSGPIQSKWGRSDLHRWTFKNAYPTGHFKRWSIFGWFEMTTWWICGAKPLWSTSRWLLDFSPSFYSCQAEPSSFPCYLFVEKKHTYIFFGEDKILTSISFTTFTVSLKKSTRNVSSSSNHSNFSRGWMDDPQPHLSRPLAPGECWLCECAWPWRWLKQRMKLWKKNP